MVAGQCDVTVLYGVVEGLKGIGSTLPVGGGGMGPPAGFMGMSGASSGMGSKYLTPEIDLFLSLYLLSRLSLSQRLIHLSL